MVLLGTDPFLNELNKLFDKGKGKDAIYITLKRSESPASLQSAYKVE